jgi:hypothetical protein
MLIAISGSSSERNNVAATIIQTFLVLKSNPDFLKIPLPGAEDASHPNFRKRVNSIIEYLQYGNTPGALSVAANCSVKTFDTTVKTTAGALLNVPAEYFYSKQYLQNELGSEWARWTTFTVIDCKGAHSEFYGNKYNTKEEAHIAAVKDQKEIRAKFSRKKLPTKGITSIAHLKPVTVEQFLQGLKQRLLFLHPRTLENALFAKYKLEPHPGPTRDLRLPNWIITDLETPGQFATIKEHKGITVRIIQPGDGADQDIDNGTIPNGKFDHIITDTGSNQELIFAIKNILLQHKIINPKFTKQ